MPEESNTTERDSLGRPKRSVKGPEKGQRRRHDWLSIRNEYVRGSDEVTGRTLSQKYAVTDSLVFKHMKAEDWAGQRAKYRSALVQRTDTQDIAWKTKSLDQGRRLVVGINLKLLQRARQALEEGGKPLTMQEVMASRVSKNAIANIYLALGVKDNDRDDGVEVPDEILEDALEGTLS